jgi:uncharacterized membrane protein
MTVTEQEISSYAEAVRRALADLPADVRDELTEDLPEHLTEVAAETDGSLADRLGAPEAYAAELRAAAGIRPAPAMGRNLDDKIAAAVRVARSRMGVADVRVGPVLGYEKASDFLALLRPGWWVLRAYLLAMLITVITTSEFYLMPAVAGSVFAGLLMLAGLVVGSVWLGRRERRLGLWPRIFVAATSVTLVLFGLVAVADNNFRGQGFDGYYQSDYQDPYVNVQDVYVYDAQGRLVEGARIFDQNGQPIRLGSPYYCDPNAYVEEPLRYVYPFCADLAPFGVAPGAAEPTAEPTAGPTAEPSPGAPTASPSAVPTATPAPTLSPS